MQDAGCRAGRTLDCTNISDPFDMAGGRGHGIKLGIPVVGTPKMQGGD